MATPQLDHPFGHSQDQTASAKQVMVKCRIIFRKSDLRDIERIIEDNLHFLLSVWNKDVAMLVV